MTDPRQDVAKRLEAQCFFQSNGVGCSELERCVYCEAAALLREPSEGREPDAEVLCERCGHPPALHTVAYKGGVQGCVGDGGTCNCVVGTPSDSPAGELWEAFRAGFDDGSDYADGFDPEEGHGHADDDYIVAKFQRWRRASDSPTGDQRCESIRHLMRCKLPKRHEGPHIAGSGAGETRWPSYASDSRAGET